jgi:Flp pilus assembly pilin Flp
VGNIMSYVKLRPLLLRLWRASCGEEGQAIFEVTMIISLVALVALLVLTALGVAVVDLFNPIADTIDG